MQLIISAVILVVASLIQSTLLPYFPVGGVKVDLVLLLVIAWSIRRGVEEGLVWAAIGGVLIGWQSDELFGVALLGYSCAAVIAGSFGLELLQVSSVLPLIVTPFAVLFAILIGALAMVLFGWPISLPATVALVAVPGVVVDSIAMLPVYALVGLLDRRTQPTPWSL